MIKKIITLFLVLTIVLLIITGLNLEYEDKEESPWDQFVKENYEETGAVNLIEAVLLDFRGYDTFGEVMILYIAISGVIIIGKEMKKGDSK